MQGNYNSIALRVCGGVIVCIFPLSLSVVVVYKEQCNVRIRLRFHHPFPASRATPSIKAASGSSPLFPCVFGISSVGPISIFLSLAPLFSLVCTLFVGVLFACG